jgi:ABC-type multidrug transport system fused ATPase/permease subunit
MSSTKGGIAGFMAYFVILRRFQSELQSLVSSVPDFAQTKAPLKKFLSVFNEEPWMVVKSGKKQFTGLKKEIKFKDFCFKYNDENGYVLKDINMSIEKGKITAIVGPSGSGKTTIAELIPRMFDYDKGKILVDGVEIKEFELKPLRKNIGVVSQDVAILSRTVRENICYGLERKVTDEELIEAAKAANIYDFIKNLPDKFESMLGERGANLSGGQKQRISIARAMLKNPDILILDEATSALDTETEFKIQESLDRIFKGRTVLAIAHRLSTIKNADKIVVLEKGQITEQGTFKELLKKKGRFYHYWEIQTELE